MSILLTLDKAPKYIWFTIIDYYNVEKLPVKLLDVGLVPGTVLKKIRCLPFKGPLLLVLKNSGNGVAIGIEEAKFIMLKPFVT